MDRTEYRIGAAKSGFAAVVMASPDASGDAEQAIGLANGTMLRRTDWSIGGHTALSAEVSLVLVETSGLSHADLSDGLEWLAATVATGDIDVIVSLDEAQIDIVTAYLLGDRVQLLCNPSLVDRVTALAIANEARARRNNPGSVREDEAARLARLNEEVARIAEVLARLSRRDDAARAVAVAEQRPRFDPGPSAKPDAIDPGQIRQVIRARRLRDRHFGDGLFEDPAWDMVLDLFAAHLEGSEVSVSSLCIAAAVPPTTALRWITRMSDVGLFERHPDPFDRRRALMHLSKRGVSGMQNYIASLKAQGLPFG